MSPAEWFGFSVTRTLAVTLRNSGTAPSLHLTLYASLNQTPIVYRHLGALPARGERTYLVSVSVPSFAVGSLTIDGHIYTSNGPLSGFHVPMTLIPFGLVIVALVIIQLVLLLARNIIRRRRGT